MVCGFRGGGSVMVVVVGGMWDATMALSIAVSQEHLEIDGVVAGQYDSFIFPLYDDRNKMRYVLVLWSDQCDKLIP